MATGDVANPRIWLDGDVYYAPVGTSVPTDVSTAFAAAWLALGLLSDEGVSESREDDTEDYFAWGNKKIRTVRSHHSRTFSVTALEDNYKVWALVNPGSPVPVTATGITTRIVKVPTPNPVAVAFHVVDGTNIKRILIPRCELSEVGDVTRSEQDIEQRELTFSVYSAADGTLYTEVTNDPQAVVP